MSSLPDEKLVVASRSGDRSAYGLLVKRHYRNVFAVCLGILGNVHDAEDATQDAMLKGYVNIGQLRKYSRFRFWIIRIAKSLCITRFRRGRRTMQIMADKQAQLSQTRTQIDRLQWAIERLPQDIRLPLSFAQSRPGEIVLTVQAKSYAPDLKEITAYEGMALVEFRLGPGQTIRGRVVDPNDNPIEGTSVFVEMWRGYRSLEWHTKTDARGYFQ